MSLETLRLFNAKFFQSSATLNNTLRESTEVFRVFVEYSLLAKAAFLSKDLW
jgi:hypothetical protein